MRRYVAYPKLITLTNNNNNNNNQSLIYAHIYIRPTAQEQKNSVHVIRNTTHRPSTQASYTASRVRLNKEIQLWRRKLQPGSQYHFLVSARWVYRHDQDTTDEFNVIELTKYWGTFHLNQSK